MGGGWGGVAYKDRAWLRPPWACAVLCAPPENGGGALRKRALDFLSHPKMMSHSSSEQLLNLKQLVAVHHKAASGLHPSLTARLRGRDGHTCRPQGTQSAFLFLVSFWGCGSGQGRFAQLCPRSLQLCI